ncbi:MAG: multicopper oxidase domain-containing protein [Proteobacteria bacterium]|nr:multicopper oxidase domain-containing protein [Pseudomonadota bacterium]
MLKRRQFIQAAGIGTSGLLIPGVALPQGGANGGNELKIPELLTGDRSGGQSHFNLRLQEGVSRFIAGLNTPTYGVNGAFLGPTLRFKNGDDIAMHVHNALNEQTTLHWHGLHVPAAADGGPHQIIDSGATWEPEFKAMQNAGTFWYHSHLVERTGEQVYKGLAGLIIIDDEETGDLSIPSQYGLDDIPLIVQDRRFNEDGSFQYIRTHMDVMLGMFGNSVLVNGTMSPYFIPTTERVRFRLLNGSNARTYNFAFRDGRAFQQITCDGGFLEHPHQMNRLELAPAERCEIVVDFSDGRPVDLLSLPMAEDSPFRARGMMANMHNLNSETFTILSVRPQSNLTHSEALPDRLTTVPRYDAAGVDRVREFTLGMSMGMGMMGGGQGRGPGGSGGMGSRMGGNFSINGAAMDMNVINERIPVGSTEIWRINNETAMMHPFHIHHGQFQVIQRNGRQPDAHERAYKDTVKVGPGERVRIVMEFEHFADPEAAYMYHCHILEHEDDGMMGQFTVY